VTTESHEGVGLGSRQGGWSWQGWRRGDDANRTSTPAGSGGRRVRRASAHADARLAGTACQAFACVLSDGSSLMRPPLANRVDLM